MATERAKQLFGTDGIRGIPGEYPLDDATLERVGSALGLHLAAQKNGTTSLPAFSSAVILANPARTLRS